MIQSTTRCLVKEVSTFLTTLMRTNSEFIPALVVMTSTNEIWHVLNVHDHLDIDKLIGNLTAFAVAANAEKAGDLLLDVVQQKVAENASSSLMQNETEKSEDAV
jgi:hypothetical protein